MLAQVIILNLNYHLRAILHATPHLHLHLAITMTVTTGDQRPLATGTVPIPQPQQDLVPRLPGPGRITTDLLLGSVS